MQTMPVASRIAVSILAGSILVARSPSSAIAIVNELRARGPFTQTVLGVTVIMDVVVIVLFAFNSSVADTLLTNFGFDLSFILLLLAELSLSLLLGYGLGKILQLILTRRINRLLKAGMILAAGYGVFILSGTIRSASHAQLPFEVFLEPLLICMIGSFILTNYTRHRDEFLQILHNVAPPIYIAFFTLTGASLALNILVKTWPIALALFVVRLLAIFIGSFSGGRVAGDPMNHSRISWMAYVTQAGIGLGLAKEVAVEFSEWGTAFATVIISVIVLNQIVGPPFFKWAINQVGESNLRAKTPEFDGVRDVIIFGLEGQSLALAHQLHSHGWQVKIAFRQADYLEQIAHSDIKICPISDLTVDVLRQLETEKAEAVVTLLSDEENYLICELIYEYFGTKDVVVRLNDRGNFHHFHGLGAVVVNPATAIVSLFDHLVRSPSAASLLLGMEKNQDIIDVEINNPNLHGVALRDLRLPLDTLVLSIHRGGRLLISHGYTRLKIGDRVTVVGSLESLDKVMLRFEK
jgi:Trk K+ transport system NAD-binding subunit/Kef-type K+ transport system membrane component KefB